MFRSSLILVFLLSAASLMVPAPGLCGDRASTHAGAADRERVQRGRELFEQRWSMAPSAFGKWGRGPTSNGEACTDCHAHAGRGRPPSSAAEPLRQGVVRLSVGTVDHPQPHPAYGEQLQYEGVLGKVPGEGEAFIEWVEHTEHFADGTVIGLRKPSLRFSQLAFGQLDPETMTSLRMAPDLYGAALLERVPQQALESIAAAQPRTGLSGRINHVTDAQTDARPSGRFGLKSNRSGLIEQIAAALHEDLGVTSPLFREENCPPVQRACKANVIGAYDEIDDDGLQALAAYLRSLEAPQRKSTDAPEVSHGERLFADAGCAACHQPELPIDTDGAGGSIHPYTDLLIHDLGDGLADGRPDGEASGRDWRTAPLWGLGRADGETTLLHDGRARSIEEAILWHGGEALPARERFRTMQKSERDALVAFLRSL
ncbi:MAG TPA: di-heme oxidoredictase family protein [Burkholderiales bacterium]|nr:di-heme oxidoredictase family protein [Burkholderiales bacterium]